jgi:hypothetical protein
MFGYMREATALVLSEFSWTEEMQKSSLSCKWVPPSVVIPASQFSLLKLLFECVLLVGRIN